MDYSFRKVVYDDKDMIIDYINEMYLYNSEINGVGRLQDFVNDKKNDFDGWFKKITDDENDIIPKICYLFIDNSTNKLIGMVNIRMTEKLYDYPYGNVGYSIRPLERGKGFGKIQFYYALCEMYSNNMTKCIMSCNKNNNNSRRIIESSYGVFTHDIDDEKYFEINIKYALQNLSEIYDKKKRY